MMKYSHVLDRNHGLNRCQYLYIMDGLTIHV